MKSLKFALVLLFGLLYLNAYGQEAMWQGYGTGLSHLTIYDEQIKFQTIRDASEYTYDYFRLNSGELALYIEQSNVDEENGFPKIRFIDSNEDSLVLKYKTQSYLFINSEKVEYKDKFVFKSMVFELLSPFKDVKRKIEFNRYGKLRLSDARNSTGLEVNVSAEELSKFEDIVSKLDIKNIYATERVLNMCNSDEYSFTFIGKNGMRYNYSAISIRETLRPVYNYLSNLIEKYDE